MAAQQHSQRRRARSSSTLSEEVKQGKENEKPRHSRELHWILGSMAVVLALLFLSPMVIREFTSFEYKGLAFTKERFGNIPVFHYSYYFTDEIGQRYQYNLYLRNDPRKNLVSMTGDVVFDRFSVAITMNSTALAQCSTSLRDIATLSRFLSDNLITTTPGNVDQKIANANNLTYVTCESNPRDTVIEIIPGKETRVEQEGRCTRIQYARCEELLPAIEKFMTEAVIDAKRTA